MSVTTYTVNESIATITMNRPEVKNAIDEEMHRELYDAFTKANEDDAVRVIVLTGLPGSFSSGADLKSIPVDNLSSMDYGDYLHRTYNRLLRFMDTIQKPIVAYINGVAAGAGLSIALACDYRIATTESKFALSFLKIGLVPDAGASYYLPRLIGLGRAMEFALGEVITAEEAYRIGLVTKLSDDANDFVARLSKYPTLAFGLMKENMKKGLEQPLSEVLELEVTAQRQAGQTKEHHMAVQAFLQKRK
ncbi:enoyl-CoA hydratase-related protein [Alkalihalobacillus sp. LMS39]|uniref:enoyl-CoA hydratase/isomerase family protein n=1 Tax=Alkalihalobacillus sp. LMS39 TaxID=2924032 RepID=UPI001FB275CD|nr:enoyl-CoA hydratase-related protein [Alkalihalobacillus sp. LMS39]UOE93997.1 enoyl-CoA hydratase-related protein [Alkalihalobacillus sp. LMS39]